MTGLYTHMQTCPFLDKFIRLFRVMGAEELGNGMTRYYGGNTTSITEAKRLHHIATSSGYKDAYIVGFREGKRIGPDELKTLEGK